jgi:hypothetical protein
LARPVLVNGTPGFLIASSGQPLALICSAAGSIVGAASAVRFGVVTWLVFA